MTYQKIALILLSLFFVTNLSAMDFPSTTIIMVRHAEKKRGKDPSLSKKGQARAQALSSLLDSYNIKGIYSSLHNRTLQTAKPLAQLKKIKINSTFKPNEYEKIFSHIKSHFLGESVLVVGHSNTIPQLANFITQHKTKEKDFDEKDFDTMFIIEIYAHNNLINNTKSKYSADSKGKFSIQRIENRNE